MTSNNQDASKKAQELVSRCWDMRIATVPCTKTEAKEMAKAIVDETIKMFHENGLSTQDMWFESIKEEIDKL